MRIRLILVGLVFLSGFFTLSFAQEKEINVYDIKEADRIGIYADNDKPYPQTVTLTLKLKGLRPSEDVPDFIVVPANTKDFRLTSLIIPLERSWQYSFSYIYRFGDANAQHKPNQEYLLPFKEGTSYRLTQGYNGTRTHQGDNALDFTMDAGTTILAARAGEVVRIKEDSNQGCGSKRCNDMGNYVTILHEDGTYADYLHLQFEGVTVELGDKVEAGDPIALSGNTGWSTGPHLHFIVRKTEKDRQVSLPTLFKTSRNKTEILIEGNIYTAIKKQ
ncbi:M23 family metallopeptidase [Roseivirga sp.]|uniref:M23 family metallopeptidase n=1 Tax=Roseivirga sp. TaxID=1964215 RepID=UPI002B26D8F6|nr:M23 family metallopeptidase [Roseivirga sp.]